MTHLPVLTRLLKPKCSTRYTKLLFCSVLFSTRKMVKLDSIYLRNLLHIFSHLIPFKIKTYVTVFNILCRQLSQVFVHLQIDESMKSSPLASTYDRAQVTGFRFVKSLIIEIGTRLQFKKNSNFKPTYLKNI